MTRYIARAVKISDDFVDERKLRTTLSYAYVWDLIKALFEHREEIDYNSWIYVVTKTYKNKKVMKKWCTEEYIHPYRPYTEKVWHEEEGYEYEDPALKDFERVENEWFENSVKEYSTLPRALLLYCKNKCYPLQLDNILMWKVYKAAKDNFFFLGGLVYALDATYDPTKNICRGPNWGEVPKDLIPFISITTPTPLEIRSFEPPDELKKFIDTNLENIKRALGIEPAIVDCGIKFIIGNT